MFFSLRQVVCVCSVDTISVTGATGQRTEIGRTRAFGTGDKGMTKVFGRFGYPTCPASLIPWAAVPNPPPKMPSWVNPSLLKSTMYEVNTWLAPFVTGGGKPYYEQRDARRDVQPHRAGLMQLTSPSGQFANLVSSSVRARVIRVAHCHLTMSCTLPPWLALLSKSQAMVR